MRFTSILVAGAVAAVAHAQSTATSTGSSTATTAPVSPVVECLDKCKLIIINDLYIRLDETDPA